MRARLVAAAAAALLPIGLTAGPTAGPSASAADSDYLHVSLTNTPDGKIHVHWDRANGSLVTKYVVYTSTDRRGLVDSQHYTAGPDAQDLDVPHTVGVTPASGDYTFVKVRVFRSDNHNGQTPTKWIMPTPVAPPATAARVTLGTFNVRVWAKGDRTSKALTSWRVRRAKIASQIRSSRAGVVFLQEASGSPAFRIAGKRWQYDDLAKRVGSRYRLTYRDQYRHKRKVIGSQGTRILYEVAKYRLLATGYLKMPAPRLVQTRWVPWARFQDRATGQQFYALSAHLQSGDDKGSSHALWNMRQVQTNYLVGQVRKLAATGRAVFLGGDLNSTSNTKPYNNVHRTFVQAGFYDAFATVNLQGSTYPTTNDFVFPVIPGPFRRDYLLSLGTAQGSYGYVNHAYQSRSSFASDHFLQTGAMPLQPGPYSRAVRIGLRG